MQFIRSSSNGRTSEMFQFESMAEVAVFSNPEKFQSREKGFVGEDLPTWDKVLDRTVRVWAEGMYTVQQYVDKLRAEKLPELKDSKRKTTFNSEEGDEMDPERLRNGEAFWKKTEREDKRGPIPVTIVVDTTTPYHTNSNDILWRGAAALALALLLEEKGYQTEIWVINGSQLYAGESTPVMTSCCLKRCGDPIDVSTLSNVVAGWFYRTVTFTTLKTICEKRGKMVSDGLGSCYYPVASDLDHLSKDRNRVYMSGVFSFDGALSAILGEVTKLAEDAKNHEATTKTSSEEDGNDACEDDFGEGV